MVRIREANVEDLQLILNIYNYAINHSTATFDLKEQTLEQREIWFNKHGGKYPIIVAEVDGQIAGYCSLSPFIEKEAYRNTAEISIYISKEFQGQGIGKALLEEIIQLARNNQFHTVISIITGGNNSSIKLHEKFGFIQVGSLREVGYKFNEYLDVYYYQLMV